MTFGSCKGRERSEIRKDHRLKEFKLLGDSASVLIGENLAIPVEEPHGVDLLSALKRGNPLMSFTTKTSTVTRIELTTHWLPSVICAKLVNVTGQCRLQPQGNAEDGRIYQMEQPEVLTFDDDMDEADALVQLQPTITLKYEHNN
ncbi:hypothetical protein DAPPUDRAFT_251941 [Daphnia pulex]|uniref:Uncharacterized protein n=1 Tax=Daphnia pulex TaxID=6669 RepID=E9H199_DAPPU|nr:hypothetical protein DAPPUDRAFT_251941 [Daphnia pulex]|eukprot:EFX74406.1 hypothetical protein DAPPUDRAFT_251941 [Daphnia pulex]